MVSDRSRIEGLPVIVTSGSAAVLGVDNPHANRRGVGIDTFGILVIVGSLARSCPPSDTRPSPFSRGPW